MKISHCVAGMATGLLLVQFGLTARLFLHAASPGTIKTNEVEHGWRAPTNNPWDDDSSVVPCVVTAITNDAEAAWLKEPTNFYNSSEWLRRKAIYDGRRGAKEKADSDTNGPLFEPIFAQLELVRRETDFMRSNTQWVLNALTNRVVPTNREPDFTNVWKATVGADGSTNYDPGSNAFLVVALPANVNERLVRAHTFCEVRNIVEPSGTNWWGSGVDFDHATNVEFVFYREPVLLSSSNGVWVFHFKEGR